jgi:Glycosyl transferase family 2
MAALPLISCLLVTLPVAERFIQFRQSVQAYCRQTYAEKELVVVFCEALPESREAILGFVDALERTDIHVVELPEWSTLGRLRNISRASAGGEFLCQWDDDDLYHPERLEQQFAALQHSGQEAVYLQEVMQFFPSLGDLYCINWFATEAKGLPSSLMCRRSADINYPEVGPASMRGEDLVVAAQLHKQHGVYLLAGMPHLYVYVSHGQNTWPAEHHRMLAAQLGISRGLLRRREAQLRHGLSAFDFGTNTITVQGNNGSAFTISRAQGSDT